MSRAQWFILILLVLSAFINYVDRGNLSVAAPVIKTELNLTTERLGFLLSSFFWTYAAFQLFGIAGWLVDRFHVALLYAIGENFRYRKDLALARGILSQGILGDVPTFQVTVRFDMRSETRRVWSDKAWRREPGYPGGYLLDTGVHAVAFLRDLLGEVAEVSARTLGHNPALGGPEGLLMQLRLENGRIGQYFAHYNARLERESALDVAAYGTHGTLEITPGRVAWSHGPGRPGGVHRVPKSDRGYEHQWRNFAMAIHGEEPLVSTPEQAYRDLLAIDGALRAAYSNTTVLLP
jgi:predicted dehydrogenase